MNLMYIILTYNRPKVAAMCVNSLFNQTKIRPDEVNILDDHSDVEFQKQLHQSVITLSRDQMPINLNLKGKNYGIGWAFEEAYRLIQWKKPRLVAILESDYIFRNEFLEDIISV